jgi:glycosyltransferase involved in cell wall biosynthesis
VSTRTALSVVVVTRDEEGFIGRVIDHIDFADEFVVVDSGSSDRTSEVASAHGARVVEQDWLGWPAHRNRAAEAATNDWVLFLDADEIVTPELAQSIREVLAGPMSPEDGYSVDRRDDVLGALMPNESRRANRLGLVRMFNRRHTSYGLDRIVHERAEPPGRTIPLDGVLLHWRGRDLDESASALNRYATIEAEALDRDGVRATYVSVAVRPLLRFLWCFVWKGGLRHGTRGLIWSFLRATAEGLRWAKLWERQNVSGDLREPPPELVEDPSSRSANLV